jgi:hypothetical protein
VKSDEAYQQDANDGSVRHVNERIYGTSRESYPKQPDSSLGIQRRKGMGEYPHWRLPLLRFAVVRENGAWSVHE